MISHFPHLVPVVRHLAGVPPWRDDDLRVRVDVDEVLQLILEWKHEVAHVARLHLQGCQMAKFDPFLSLDCAGVEGGAGDARSKERKGSNLAAQRSGAIVLQARRAKHIQS